MFPSMRALVPLSITSANVLGRPQSTVSGRWHQDHELSETLRWLFAYNTLIPLHTLELSIWFRNPAPLLYAKLAKLAESSEFEAHQA